MKKYVNKIKKTLLCMVLALTASLSFAQEADDGFVVPLNEDFSKAITVSSVATTPTGPMANVKQGLWIETTSSNQSLIRDIATGKKKGYEFDNAHFISEANWWFWGDITDNFHLDATISIWEFDKTLYQANSYGANVPDVTWGDGLQTLFSMPFSFIYNMNDDGVAMFDKLGFTMTSPFVDVKLGYGDLKANGMLDFDGIYHVIDRWDYVDKGFTEVSLGKDLRQFGDITLNATAAFSMMRGSYGLYDLLDVKYGDEKNPTVQAALTFGSYTNEEELFRYNEQNINAASAYFAVNPLDPLKLELHALGTFGTDVDLDKDAVAVAGRLGWNAEKWSVSVMESYSATNVNSVWGSDGTDYDDINANTSTSQVNLFAEVLQPLSFGLDETVTYVLNDEEGASKHNQYKGYASFRTQPYFDIDLSSILQNDITAGLYSVVRVDKLASATNTDGSTKVLFNEAGTEFTFSDFIPGIKKLTFDYAVKANAEWEMESSKVESNNNYDIGEMFHSVMLTAEVSDDLLFTVGALYRNYSATLKSSFVEQNLGLACGFKVKKTPLPGHPQFWMHFTYGMDPYEDLNYSLFRADDSSCKPLHRTYLLNTLDDTTGNANVSSYVRLGLIWDLQ